MFHNLRSTGWKGECGSRLAATKLPSGWGYCENGASATLAQRAVLYGAKPRMCLLVQICRSRWFTVTLAHQSSLSWCFIEGAGSSRARTSGDERSLRKGKGQAVRYNDPRARADNHEILRDSFFFVGSCECALAYFFWWTYVVVFRISSTQSSFTLWNANLWTLRSYIGVIILGRL